jgi:tRNA-modifying protein YgfZ
MSLPSSLAISRWEISCLLRVTGTEAETFLQGQFTNDLRALASGRGVYGLWLNQKGKVQGDSFILRGALAGEFWVVSYFSAVAEVRRRLEDYIIADDVVIEDATSDWSGVSLLGSGAGAWLAGKTRVGLIFPGRRTREENWEWIFPKTEAATVQVEVAAAPEIDAKALGRLRLAAGIPAVPADIGPGDLPAEGGLEADAISFTKGCYLGQEVMARLKSMGQVRRRLLRVRGRGPMPAVPSKLIQEQKQVGELRTVAGGDGDFFGHAMVSLINLRKDRPVLVEGAPLTELEIVPDTA